jgi:hypothetical protein
MAKYLLAYKGGGMASTDAEREAAMAAWGAWMGGVGEALIDVGNPFGPSKALSADGSMGDGAPSQLTGYSILQADSFAAAAELSKGCPIFAAGGSIDIYEAHEVM